MLGAVGIENRARIDLGRDAIRNAGREVRFDQSGDDIDRRALGRQHQMNADGARHLRQTRDRIFDFMAGSHHQVGEFVDDDHDERHARPWLAVFVKILDGIAALALGVVAVDVADAPARQLFVTPFHLADRPAQRARGAV